MSHDVSPPPPATRPFNSIFVSGIVVGLTLGIAAGHLLLFARGRSAESVTTAEEEFAQLVAASPRFAAMDGPVPAEDTSFSILEFDPQDDVGRVRLSDRSPVDEDMHYFPEALNPPGADFETSTNLSPAGRTAMTGPLQMTAETSHARDVPPQALQPPPAAAPIDKATSDRQTMARTIIRDEMPEATAQEREIWLEVLQGLPAEDIKGILRMRKHIGPRSSLDLCPPLALPTPLTCRTPDTGFSLQAIEEGSPVGRRLRQMTWHNLVNRSSVAFKQRIPVLVEAPADDSSGIVINHVIRDMRQGELESTARPLDIALSGPGFLQVRRDDDVRYTRDGRLTLDDQGRLKLLAPADTWLIEPPIAVPGNALDVVISAEGEVSAVLPGESNQTLGSLRIVRFLDPSALRTEQEGLYEPTRASGGAQEATPAQRESTLVVQGHLERSNVIAPETPGWAGDDAAADRR
jgi:flagellar basal body rod protein FlgF